VGEIPPKQLFHPTRYWYQVLTLDCGVSAPLDQGKMSQYFINSIEQPPKSSVVYVVYAVDQKRIYILSRSVNMMYYVLKSQLEDGSYEPLSNDFYKNWTWQKGDDQGGFFDGVPADVLLNQITHGNSLPILLDYNAPSTEANSIIIPYDRIDIDNDNLQSLFDGKVPSLEDIQFEYTNMTKCSTIGISIPKHQSMFVFVKIDQLVFFREYERKHGRLFVETMLSGPMRQNDLDLVRSIAVRIVNAAVVGAVIDGVDITQEVHDIIITRSVNWPTIMQNHVIVE
jgi:hypothetical protein